LSPSIGVVFWKPDYWELCVLMALRDGLRSGDVHVPGSRRYADPASLLLAAEEMQNRSSSE
jgi:hypothetical protein